MHQDSDTVPVTVTVGHPGHPAHLPGSGNGPPHSLLPFTGSVAGILLTVGVLLALVGCTLVTVVRRRTRHDFTGSSA
jgi:hypothetical protein